jgi:hypothetical protein
MLTSEFFDIEQANNAAIAGGGTAVAGPLNGAKLILSTSQFQPTKHTAPADLTAPTWTGYAPYPLTWGSAARDDQGDIVTLSSAVRVQMGAATDPQTSIWGYAVVDSTDTNVLISEAFSQSVGLVDNLSFFEVFVPYAPGNPQGKLAQVVS